MFRWNVVSDYGIEVKAEDADDTLSDVVVEAEVLESLVREDPSIEEGSFWSFCFEPSYLKRKPPSTTLSSSPD